MSNSELLTIQPLNLQFPFELEKKISCSLYLTNKTDNNVAYKVKTTNPNNYKVRPNYGLLLPRSTCEVLVTMQAQKEAPSDMQSNDKFLIQSVIASPGVTAKEVTREMFSKEAGNLVQETKLRVTYFLNNELLTIQPMHLQLPWPDLVACNHIGKTVTFQVNNEYNLYYFAVLIKYVDGDGEIGRLELKQALDSDTWLPMSHSWGAVWKLEVSSPLRAPLSLRVTSLNSGETVVASDVIPTNWQSGVTYKSNVNFQV